MKYGFIVIFTNTYSYQSKVHSPLQRNKLLTRLHWWSLLLAYHRHDTIHHVKFQSKRSTFQRSQLVQRPHNHLSRCHCGWLHDYWSYDCGCCYVVMMNPNARWFWHDSFEYDCNFDYSFFVSLCHNNWMTYPNGGFRPQ